MHPPCLTCSSCTAAAAATSISPTVVDPACAQASRGGELRGGHVRGKVHALVLMALRNSPHPAKQTPLSPKLSVNFQIHAFALTLSARALAASMPRGTASCRL